MKKIISFIIIFLLLIGQTFAYDFKSGSLYYIRQGSLTVGVTYQNLDTMNYSGLTTISIPSTVSYNGVTYSVTTIGKYAFRGCRGLTEVTIPNSVTTIDFSAFDGCSSLTAVTIGNSVTSIGSDAFYDCSGLTEVTIPNSVIGIGNGAFENCSGLKSITIPNSVTRIGNWAFRGCKTTIICETTSKPSGWDDNWNQGNGGTVVWGNQLATIQPQQPKLTSKPPILDIVQNSVQFVDYSGNNAIDGNESCKIQFDIKNSGQGDGVNCVAKISVHKGSSKGLQFSSIKLPTIMAGKTQHVEIPIQAGNNVENGIVVLSIEVEEPKGFGSDPVQLTVNTKAFEAPLVQVVDYTVTGSNGTTIAKREEFNLQLLVQNTKYGTAENVNVKIELPTNVFMMSGEQQTSFSILKAGEQQLLSYSLIVNNNYSSTEIPIKVLITEKYGKYAENKTITLKMNQTLASNALVINEKTQQRQQIQIGALGSDIDKGIPQTNTSNPKTFAVIIANENYQRVAEVPYARNDGEIFRQYCVKTLGIPERNIHFSTNATLNNIKADVRWLKQVIDAYGGEARVIFYYAGHGIPDEAQKTAYLLPVDGFGNDVSTGYKLDDLYSTLGNLPSTSVTVFLDACFSGANRDGQMLASARGVAIKAKSSAPVGNMVVFSAAQGDETAYPNNEQQHGMFTYYLLKKIKETSGNVTYKELGDYVTDNVRKQSIVVNGKSQTPMVVPSATVGGNWESWKLK